jgi:hypothetical protein
MREENSSSLKQGKIPFARLVFLHTIDGIRYTIDDLGSRWGDGVVSSTLVCTDWDFWI